MFTNDFYEGEFQEPRYNEEDEEDWRPVPQRGLPPRRRATEQDGFGRVKIKIPSFEGKCDADAYIEWETKVEQIWSCHNFPEERKVQLAALEFNDYALAWWSTLVKNRARALDPPVRTWAQMRALMRTRFIPPHHNRELLK